MPEKRYRKSSDFGFGVAMRKARNVLKRTLNLLLIVSLLLSVLPLGAFAASGVNPVVEGVSMNTTRSYITVRFDRDIEGLSPKSFSGKVKLSKGGGSLSNLPSSTAYSVSGSCLYITLNAALSTSDNFFRIAKGTFSGQTEDVDTPLFDARGPELAEENSVVIDGDEQTVTIKFKTGIKGYPNNESLKNGYITLARNGSSFNETIPEDHITIDSEKGEIEIYLDEWLSGKYSKFRIAAGKLQNLRGNINLTEITTPAIDASATSATPEIDYTNISDTRNSVTIYFTQRIKNGLATSGVNSTLATSLLKSNIWVSRGSANKYETLAGNDSVSVGSNYIKITFSEPLSASKNYIKISGGTIADYYGKIIATDIITDDVTKGVSASTAPSYASAFLSSSKKIVIYFTVPVQKNSELTTSELRSRITLSRNGNTFETLSSYDSVSFSDNMMTITLREELTGSYNRVRVTGNTISSKTGALLTSSFTTGYLTAGMADDDDYEDNYYDEEGAPEFTKITYDSSAQRARIYFDRDIKKVSKADLYDDITVSRNGGSYEALSSNDVVTISPSNAITILLSEPLEGTRNRFRIDGNTIADYDSGYVQNDTIVTDYVSASGSSSSSSSSSSDSGSSDYSGDVTATLSEDLYTVTLKFNEALYNNKDSLDELKEKIQISRNGRFETLTSNDYIRLDTATNELLIVLAEPADEYFSQIKILSGALRDADGGSVSSTITTLPLGEADGAVRTYINNAVVPGFTSEQASGESPVISVSGLSKFNSYAKEIEFLVKVPGTAKSATLNITGDIVENLKRYGSTVALSLGNATYYLPAGNIAEISSSDTLSITVSDSASSVSSALASASSADSFTIESHAKNLRAKLISASGTSKDITHSVFAEKRFLLTEPGSNKTAFTVARIEKSGSVVPVPSSSDITSGVVYLTAKTMTDGDYAAISSARTLSTLTWAQSPTNALAARLILTGKSGSNLNGSEAVSRSETVTIMSRTLGILCDSEGASPFFDMISTDSYFDAVMSTVSYELISGYPDSTFKPSNKLTRAEAMTIVARAIRFMNGKSVSESSDMTISEATSILSKFTDAGTVDDWAKVNIAECVQAGIVNGDNNGRLNPKANVTRAELIQLMYNILDKCDII